MRKKIHNSGYIFNMIIPFIFIEWIFVLIAFIFIVTIETSIIKIFIKDSFKRLLIILLKANLITTLAGYLLQGIIRLFIGAFTKQYFDSRPIIQGIFSIGSLENGQTVAIYQIITSVKLNII